jgi:hypothetical protein
MSATKSTTESIHTEIQSVFNTMGIIGSVLRLLHNTDLFTEGVEDKDAGADAVAALQGAYTILEGVTGHLAEISNAVGVTEAGT